MWIIAICIVFWLASYGGMPSPANEIVRLLSELGFVASVIGCIIAWFQDEKARKTEKPNLMTFHGTYPEYKQALAEWEKAHEVPLNNLPLNERLSKRNCKHNVSHGHDRDDKCSICGGIKIYGQPYCTECLDLYKSSPKEPMPEGIPEKHRMMLWAVLSYPGFYPFPSVPSLFSDDGSFSAEARPFSYNALRPWPQASCPSPLPVPPAFGTDNPIPLPRHP